MKKMDVGRTVTLIANVGVILGILLLAVEIRQANNIAVATTQIEVRNSWNSLNASIYSDSGLAELLAKAIYPDPELSLVESIKLRGFVDYLLNTWTLIETACSSDLATNETCVELEDEIQRSIRSMPGAQPMFRQAVADYPAYADHRVFQVIQSSLDEVSP